MSFREHHQGTRSVSVAPLGLGTAWPRFPGFRSTRCAGCAAPGATIRRPSGAGRARGRWPGPRVALHPLRGLRCTRGYRPPPLRG